MKLIKVIEFSDGTISGIYDNGCIDTIQLEEAQKINSGFDYETVDDIVPEIFTYKINNKFRVLYQNGRVEMLDNTKSSFDKFKGNYKKVISCKSEDFNLVHYITFKDGSTEFLTWDESLTKSFVIKKEVAF